MIKIDKNKYTGRLKIVLSLIIAGVFIGKRALMNHVSCPLSVIDECNFNDKFSKQETKSIKDKANYLRYLVS